MQRSQQRPELHSVRPEVNCSCASLFTPFADLVDDGWLDTQQKILASMVSYGKSANAPKPTLNCAYNGPAHLNRDWALGQVSTFRNSNMNKRVLPKTPAISQKYVEGTQEYFVAGTGQNITLSIGWAPGDACNKKGDGRAYPVDVDECNKQLKDTIEQCDTSGPTDGKHGGQVTEGCIIFANAPQTHPPSSSATPSSESYCTSDSDCTSERCPIGSSTCEPFGAPGVNPQGLK